MLIKLNKSKTVELDPSELAKVQVKFTLFHGRRFSYESKSHPQNSFKNLTLNQLIAAVQRASTHGKQNRKELFEFIEQFHSLENKGYDIPKEGLYTKNRLIQFITQFKHRRAQKKRDLLLKKLFDVEQKVAYQLPDDRKERKIKILPENAESNFIYKLPKEMKRHLFGFLDLRSLLNLSYTSKQNYQFIESNLVNEKFQGFFEYKVFQELKKVDFKNQKVDFFCYYLFCNVAVHVLGSYPEMISLLEENLENMDLQSDKGEKLKCFVSALTKSQRNLEQITYLLEKALSMAKNITNEQTFDEVISGLAKFFAKQDPQKGLTIAAQVKSEKAKEKLICELSGIFIATCPEKSFELIANVTAIENLLGGLNSVLKACLNLKPTAAAVIVSRANTMYQQIKQQAVGRYYYATHHMFLSSLHRNYLTLQQYEEAEKVAQSMQNNSVGDDLILILKKFPERFSLFQPKILGSIERAEQLYKKQMSIDFNIAYLTYFSNEKHESFKEFSKMDQVFVLNRAAQNLKKTNSERCIEYMEESLQLLLEEEKQAKQNLELLREHAQFLAEIAALYKTIDLQKSKDLLNKVLQVTANPSVNKDFLTVTGLAKPCYHIDKKFTIQMLEQNFKEKGTVKSLKEILTQILQIYKLSDKYHIF